LCAGCLTTKRKKRVALESVEVIYDATGGFLQAIQIFRNFVLEKIVRICELFSDLFGFLLLMLSPKTSVFKEKKVAISVNRL
jgi:hypothetical protein